MAQVHVAYTAEEAELRRVAMEAKRQGYTKNAEVANKARKTLAELLAEVEKLGLAELRQVYEKSLRETDEYLFRLEVVLDLLSLDVDAGSMPEDNTVSVETGVNYKERFTTDEANELAYMIRDLGDGRKQEAIDTYMAAKNGTLSLLV